MIQIYTAQKCTEKLEVWNLFAGILVQTLHTKIDVLLTRSSQINAVKCPLHYYPVEHIDYAVASVCSFKGMKTRRFMNWKWGGGWTRMLTPDFSIPFGTYDTKTVFSSWKAEINRPNWSWRMSVLCPVCIVECLPWWLVEVNLNQANYFLNKAS